MNSSTARCPRVSGRMAALGLMLAAWTQVGVAAPVSWQGWTFDFEVSGNDDGLSLLNVRFQGHAVLRKLSFPVVRVFYDNDQCGPYTDRLGGSLLPIPWSGNATIAQREFTLNGQLWYEIGIRDQIGSYDLYQVYYLGADGTVDAHLYSKGLQCVANHVHYPNWRFDFDLDGPAEDQILRNTGTGFAVVPTEFDFDATSAANHAWRVRDVATGFHVDVLPGFPDFVIPDGSTTVPVTAYSNNSVFGRVYHLNEDEGWEYGPINQVPFNDRESIAAADTVLWYEGYLPHSASEGSALWHSTGVRLFVDPDGSPPPPPPEPPPPTQTYTYTGGPLTILDNAPGSPYPSTVSVPVLSGTVSKVTVRIDGLTHTYPTDIDLALAGPGGQAVMLMSDVGGGDDVNGVSLTFDAGAFAALPGAFVSSGVFRPTNSGASDSFAAPAPTGTYGTDLGVFNNLAPNGIWRLYVKDDENSDVGVIASWVLTIQTIASAPDADNDGVVDSADNCTLAANPTQLDADNDGYGNLCDGDINNSGAVTTADYGLMRTVLGLPASASATAAAADMNGSGTVTAADVGLLRSRLGTPVGPSGLHP